MIHIESNIKTFLINTALCTVKRIFNSAGQSVSFTQKKSRVRISQGLLQTMKNQKKIKFYRHLLNITGIGLPLALLICQKLGIGKDTYLEELSNQKKENWELLLSQIKRNKKSNYKPASSFLIKNSLNSHQWPLIDDNLYINLKDTNIKKLNIKYKKAIRAKSGYPIRGQRTRSNASTAFRLNKAR